MHNKQKYEDLYVGFEFEIEGKTVDIFELMHNTQSITRLDEEYIEEYHSTKYKTFEKGWRLESDSSIDGAEFISPPEKYAYAKHIMKEFFKEIEQTSDIYTTDSCGFHCNISINNNLDGIDMETFLTSINTRLLYKLWPERFGPKHEYCTNFKRILNILAYKEYYHVINTSNLVTNVFDQSYGFIKIKKMNGNKYIEIRVPGGKNYHRKEKEILATIEHIADALYKAKKIKNKKVKQKITSYVNRISNNKRVIGNIKQKDLNALKNENVTATTLEIMVKNLQYSSLYFNNKYLLYYLTKNVAKNRVTLLYYIKMYIDANETYIDIPKTETNSEKLKLLKHWKKLPKDFCKNLISSLNKRALQYFVKYNPSYKVKNSKIKSQLSYTVNGTVHENVESSWTVGRILQGASGNTSNGQISECVINSGSTFYDNETCVSN